MKLSKKEAIQEIKRYKVIVVPAIITTNDVTWVRVYKNDLLKMMEKKAADEVFDVYEEGGELILSSTD